MRQKEFDPLAYIENAFLDKEKREVLPDSGELTVAIPSIGDYLNNRNSSPELAEREPLEEIRPEPTRRVNNHHALLDEITDSPGDSGRRTRFKKTLMSAPRPRRVKGQPTETGIDPDLQSTWETLPKSIEFLCSFFDDAVTSNYYRGDFRETRNALVKRLLDPELSLEETSRLLGVCPATVRRYTNREWLTHHRTTGGQRRFRLSDVVRFVEVHGRFPEE